MKPKVRVRELEGSIGFYRKLLEISGDSKYTFRVAFIGLVESESRLADKTHPFKMKPVWPKIGS